MQAVGGRKVGEVKEWLALRNILRITKLQYLPGRQSRLFFVNVPLMVWLAGFHNEDLSWLKGQRTADT